jgi:hypothetical protein
VDERVGLVSLRRLLRALGERLSPLAAGH